MNTRQRWLALALVVTLIAAFWPGSEDSVEVVETVRRAEDPARTVAPVVVDAAVPTRPAPAPRERLIGMQANLFPTQTWVPPPPPPKPYIPPPPPPPKPPPLPFKFLGRWVENGQQTLYLVQGEEPIPIRPGQVLASRWRVDEITDRTVVFTYLPLDMQSILGITP
jgi:hypothetical protein